MGIDLGTFFFGGFNHKDMWDLTKVIDRIMWPLQI